MQNMPNPAHFLLLIASRSHGCSPLLNRQTVSANEQERTFTTNLSLYKEKEGTFSKDGVKYPKWFTGKPVLYIQRYIMEIYYDDVKSKLWTEEEMNKKTLLHSFYLVDNITNFKSLSGKKIGNFCFKAKGHKTLFSSSINDCIIAAPTNFWPNLSSFNSDKNVIERIIEHSNADLLIGVPVLASGFQQQTVPGNYVKRIFSVSVVMSSFENRFLKELHEYLGKFYYRDFNVSHNFGLASSTHIQHIYYSEASGILELLPLLLTHVIVFLYIAFSVAKIEMVRSKWALAFSAVCTIFAALTMPLGISTYLQLDSTLQNREIYPYIIIIIGLENILIITKSVVSTPMDLEVRERIAEGLSKEGWSIWKTFFFEVITLLAGYFINVPAIQEFCVFASVAVISEYFLQMFFFVPVLAIEIRRIELTDLNKQNIRKEDALSEGEVEEQPIKSIDETFQSKGSDENFMSPSFTRQAKMPKRLAFAFSFWARTRIVQRVLLLCMIGYILYVITYIVFPSMAPNGSGNVQRVSVESPHFFSNMEVESESRLLWKIGLKIQRSVRNIVATESSEASSTTSQLPWEAWYRLLSLNNYHLAGMHIGLLSPVVLKREYSSKPGRMSVDVMNLTKQEDISVISIDGVYLVFAVLILFIIICYTLTVLMKYLLPTTRDILLWFIRMCQPPQYRTTIADNAPIILRGHGQDIECLDSNGSTLVTSCLEGKVIAWNVITGEQYCILRRNEILPLPRPRMDRLRNHYDDSLLGMPVRGNARMYGYMQGEIAPAHLGMTGSQSTYFGDVARSPVSPMYKTHRRSRSDEVNSRTIVESTFATSMRPVSVAQRLEENFGKGTIRQRRSDLSVLPDGQPLSSVDGYVSSKNILKEHESYNKRSLAENYFQNLYDSSSNAAIWCLLCHDNIIIIGCCDGSVEVWDIQSNYRLCCYRGCSSGVTCLSAIKNRIFVGRSYGRIDILQISTFKPYGGSSNNYGNDNPQLPQLASINLLCTKKWHHETLNTIKIAKEFAITASQDKTIKVMRLSDYGCTYTLHGHSDSVSCLNVDLSAGFFCVSGSADCSLRVWDLSNGSCVHHLSEEHTTAITVLECNHKYAVSISIDNVLCIWKYRAGVCIHRIVQSNNIIGGIALLSSALMVTGSQGCIVVWNVRSGRVMRTITLGEYDCSNFVSHMQKIDNTTVACSYGNEMYIISFSSVVEKKD
ncbi:uncharacterized protein TRIADDRAFT_55014 [Trichoplax adhaerens]|uniref:Sterol regulatory element-binding protein cleavage-activating protein n=1 Tax=Trichoplax adhaerens TaxID=10228 RepID=B3RQJ7_TRIAD|nr:hypothetical protein TRIADDRAFT_55014 [Trichoplax adhaerens]EDV27257.1 hypothetical protein TRIADDRAFT_55014 [Trichoplax adhaerens]|eukprot:XP_002111253.1 hypothetical protein TRIADDRAFT_55014 [Trichoplax adhaerens]